jgi:putative ABC transport system permease protein
VSLARLVLRSLVFNCRTGVVIVFGFAVAVATITGSLVIGDSMRGSLRDTALSRLGRIDYALSAPGFFRDKLATDLVAHPSLATQTHGACSLLMTRGAARNAESEAVIPEVQVVGVPGEFWPLFDLSQPPQMTGRECAVSAALARDLGVREGQYVIVSVHRESEIAADTLFFRRDLKDTAPSLRLQVKAVLPAGGVGDFRLDPQSGAPRNLFLSRDWLQNSLHKKGLANTLVLAGKVRSTEELGEALSARCRLRDYGLKLVPNPKRGYVSLFSDGMLLSDAQAQATREAAKACKLRSGLTSVYLATRLRKLNAPAPREVPYSVVAAVEPLKAFALKPPGGKPLDVGGIWLSEWTATDLGAKLGDLVELTYLRPTPDGSYPTAATRMVVRGIVAMSGPAVDGGLSPDFEGMTSAKRIQDWDSPFPVDLTRIKPRDEQFWDLYRAAPKAFISKDTAREMWRSAPGQAQSDWITSVRVALPAAGSATKTTQALENALLRRLKPEEAGLVFRPVREQALAASQGTSDFGQLFLGLSMFLVASGAALGGMMLRLSFDRRASEAGIMLACGLEKGQVARARFGEGMALALVGTALGVPAGVGYAATLIKALALWWSGALGATATIWLHVSAASLAVGAVAGLLVGALMVAWSTRRLGRRGVLELLAGWQGLAVAGDRTLPSGRRLPRRRRRKSRAAQALMVFVMGALALLVWARLPGGLDPQGAFFGVGACLLGVGVCGATVLLRRVLHRSGASRSLPRLALRNLSVAGSRSLLVFGLLAAASFVIVAVAANTRDFTRTDFSRRDSGTGGFSLQATSTVPLSYDLGTAQGRAKLGFSDQDEALFKGVEIVSFLASPGEDVSCLNLARPTQPRILGVPSSLVRSGRFTAQQQPDTSGASGPLGGLDAKLPDGAIPAYGDADSVRWTLHSGLGKSYPVTTVGGKSVNLRFVGLIPRSIFARELLVSEANLRHLYPAVSGASYFLIAAPAGQEQQVAEALRRNLGEMGLQVHTTREVLNEFLQVQNTYLSMFLALGGLGLLLGTVGMVAVLLRSAFERRREMALMLATGFERSDLARLLLIENAGLLTAGLVWGTGSALVAVIPQLASAEAQVNWVALFGVLVTILIVGLASCVAAAHGAVRGELLPALRQE